jgi:hypothetical protein
MSSDVSQLRGVVHGRTIELDEAIDLPDGQAVVVSLRPLTAHAEAIWRTAGAWSDDAKELDAFRAEMRRSRQMDRGEPTS